MCVPSVCWATEERESSSTSSALAPSQIFQLLPVQNRLLYTAGEELGG